MDRTGSTGSVDVGTEQVVFVGFGGYLLRGLSGRLPRRSVVVLEEPDAIRKRGLTAALGAYPMVSRILPWEYVRRADPDELLAAEPGLRRARAVVPGIEYGVTAAAGLAEALRLPGAGSRAGQVFRDKHALRALAGRAGLRNPRHALVRSPAEAADFLAAVGGRCVLKPTGRQASMGVRIVDHPEQLPSAWAAAAETVDDDAPDRGLPSQVLAEELVAGQEYSVELLVARGSCLFANVTAKHVLLGRYPVETGHVVPAGIGAELRDRLVSVTRTLCRAARFGDGVLHAEWLVDDGEPTLVECAARIPGGEITRLVSLAYGFPFLPAYLDVLLGDVPALPRQPVGAAAVRFLVAEPGTVRRVSGVDAAAAMPGVLSVDLAVAPGDHVRATRSSWDRAGQVVVQAGSPAAADAAARAAVAAVTITT